MNKEYVSIVIPAYNEEVLIYPNMQKIFDILAENNIKHEIIVVDDGSSDNTWTEIQNTAKVLPTLKGIKFSRNFGKESAICAGLQAAIGDCAIVMDADLQHPPELIPDMVNIWRNNDVDIVEGVKASRGKEGFFHRLNAKMFYGSLKRLSGIDLDMASDFKLLDRKVIEAWKQMGERTTFFRGMSNWVGFKREEIPFDVAPRTQGKTKWSFFSLGRLAIDAITSFSAVPLQIVTFSGFALLICSIILAIQTLVRYFMGHASNGFTTVILLILVIGSIITISLGIIGTYISKIYEEVKYRPRYIISERTEKED